MAVGPGIGIDFGTSHTVALLAWPDGRVRPLLFDGSPLLPSAVYAQPDGRLLVGRDAVHAARLDPARFEASPKRRIDDGTVLLGDREFAVPTLIAGVLAYVAQEAMRVGGAPPVALTLTHPASWGVSRRLALVEGAKLAGLPQPVLMPEPVAAARYFAGVLGRHLGPDQGLLVYDFGGGTFDASMVVRVGEGFDVRAVDGIDDLGGVDLDELIVAYAREQVPDEALWARLSNPQTTEDRRHRRLLWDDARMAKEMLSRSEAAGLHLPIVASDVTIPRAEFEQRARPMLEQTVRTTSAVLRWSGVDRARLAGVFLVGGSSRIPLVATLLQRELGLPPTVIEQPELVVGEGSLRGMRPPVSTPPGGLPAAVSAPPRPNPNPVSAAPMGPPPISPVSPSPVSPSPLGANPHGASPVSSTPVSPMPGPVSPMPPPPPNRQMPVWPVPPPPGPAPAPTVYPPMRQALPVQGKKRRNVAVPVLAALLALSLALAVFVWYQFGRKDDNGGVGTGGPSATVTTPGAPYQRPERPEWLPAGWSLADKRPPNQMWANQDESEGGRCETGGGKLHVKTTGNVVTGCSQPSPLDSRADVAVEVQVSVAAGCAGVWARNGAKAYTLLVCRDRAELHLLAEDPPSDASRLDRKAIDGASGPLVVGLMTVGTTVSAYLNGKQLMSVDNGDIKRGRVNAGGIADGANRADVTFVDFRVFVPPQADNPGPAPSTSKSSPSPSPSTRPSRSTPPSPPPTT